MTTATAEQTTTMAAPVPVKEALFVSRYPDHKLFLRQPNRTVEHGVVVYKEGQSIQFVNHEYRTKDPIEQGFIRNHRLFGTSIIEVSEGELPTFRPAPVPMQRGTSVTKQTEADNGVDNSGNRPGKVIIPCDFEGCTFVAEGDDQAQAQRKLNGHKTASGHRRKE